MIYIVTEEGVCRHSILGIFTTQEAAEKRAKAVAESEKPASSYYWRGDGYHSYQVSSALPDADIEDVTPICEYKRNTKSIFGKWELEEEATRRAL